MLDKSKVSELTFVSRSQAAKDTGISYLGGVNTSSKIKKADKYNELTYIIYLSPYDSSGFNVCGGATKECIDACLHESGHGRMDTKGIIKEARINRTQLFYYNREFFMQWMIAEIDAYRKKAEKMSYRFSVRVNGTSDLSLALFKLEGKNILELYPDVQFYDYTKIQNRIKLLRYPNYDLTYSFNGHNWDKCEESLNQGMRVAVVFKDRLPESYKGYKVIDGDTYDMRYLDEKNVIVGLKFKVVKNKIDLDTSPFIVSDHLNAESLNIAA